MNTKILTIANQKLEVSDFIIMSIIAETKAARWRHNVYNYDATNYSHVWIMTRTKPRVELELTYYSQDNTIEVSTYVRVPMRDATPLGPFHCDSKCDSDYLLYLDDHAAMPKLIRWINYRIARLARYVKTL